MTDAISTPSPTSAPPSASTDLRRGHLRLPDVIAQSVSIIAPGMSGGFLTYLAATKAGGATPLAYVLAGIGALFIGGVVSEFGKSMSSAGSLYTYTSAGWSKTAGFVVGWMYSLALIVLGAAVLAGFGLFMSLFVQSITDSATFVPWYAFFIAGIVFVALMSLFNIRISTRTQLVFTAASVAVMVIAAIWVIGKGTPAVSVIDGKTALSGAGRSLDLGAFWPKSAGVGWGGIMLGFAFGILSFTGFEGGAVLAEETDNPKHNIPRAVVGSVVVSGLFYVLITYATSIGFGIRQAAIDWPTSASGLVAVASPVSKTLANLVLFAVAVSSLLCAIGVLTASSRMMYAMGREGMLPGALGRTHPKWKTPWVAILSTLVVWMLLIWGLLLVVSHQTEAAMGAGTPTSIRGGFFAFGYWATLATPAVMLSYLLLGIAGFRKGQADGNSRLQLTGVLAALTGLVAVVGSLYYSFKEAAPGAGILTIIKLIPWINLAAVVIGLVVAFYLRGKKQTAWNDMGAVFE
jgi:amino acid transporter